MSKSRRTVLIAVIGFCLLLAGFAIALIVLVDADAYRDRLETAASDALEMDVRFEGRVGVRFSPGLHLRFEDVSISNDGEPVASAREATLGVEIWPLFRREVRIRTLALKGSVLTVERRRDGTLNVEDLAQLDEILSALGLARISVLDGTLAYKDQRTGAEIRATDCSLDLRHLQLPGGEGPDLMRTFSLTAEIACGEVRPGDFVASGLKAEAVGTNGVLVFDPIVMTAFGAQGTGTIRVDFTGESPAYHVRYALPQIPLQELFAHLATDRSLEGTLDFSADLSTRGATVGEMKRNAGGEFSMRGENLVLTGIDLDRSLREFESSQTFSLLDAGAVFLAGPFGLVATKGYKFASLALNPGGRSEIRTLVSDWHVEGGVARAHDVAMATAQNRIAAQGRLDLVNERFVGLTVALLDAEGCARVKQELRGSFADAEGTKPAVLELITGPARSLIEKGVELFTGRDCEVFYSGSVASPR